MRALIILALQAARGAAHLIHSGDLPPRHACLRSFGRRTPPAARKRPLLAVPKEKGGESGFKAPINGEARTAALDPADEAWLEGDVWQNYLDSDPHAEERAAFAAKLKQDEKAALGPDTFNAVRWSEGGLTRFGQTPFAIYWDSLPDMAVVRRCYIGNAIDRMAALKLLMRQTDNSLWGDEKRPSGPIGALPAPHTQLQYKRASQTSAKAGSSDQRGDMLARHPWWALVWLLDWLWRSGRLANGASSSSNRGKSTPGVAAAEKAQEGDIPGPVACGSGWWSWVCEVVLVSQIAASAELEGEAPQLIGAEAASWGIGYDAGPALALIPAVRAWVKVLEYGDERLAARILLRQPAHDALLDPFRRAFWSAVSTSASVAAATAARAVEAGRGAQHGEAPRAGEPAEAAAWSAAAAAALDFAAAPPPEQALANGLVRAAALAAAAGPKLNLAALMAFGGDHLPPLPQRRNPLLDDVIGDSVYREAGSSTAAAASAEFRGSSRGTGPEGGPPAAAAKALRWIGGLENWQFAVGIWVWLRACATYQGRLLAPGLLLTALGIRRHGRRKRAWLLRDIDAFVVRAWAGARLAACCFIPPINYRKFRLPFWVDPADDMRFDAACRQMDPFDFGGYPENFVHPLDQARVLPPVKRSAKGAAPEPILPDDGMFPAPSTPAPDFSDGGWAFKPVPLDGESDERQEEEKSGGNDDGYPNAPESVFM